MKMIKMPGCGAGLGGVALKKRKFFDLTLLYLHIIGNYEIKEIQDVQLFAIRDV